MNYQETTKRSDVFLENSLVVHSIFKTIQGEGVFSGHPAIFVRLYGCNLQCPLCDTDYTSSKEILSTQSLTNKILSLAGSIRLVIITGGEPLMQNIGTLINILHEQGFKIQIETNGTVYNEHIDYKKCIVVCSPKLPTVHSKLLPHITAFKYVMGSDSGMTEQGLPRSVLGLNKGVVYQACKDKLIFLQPADEKDPVTNKRNTGLVVDSCLENGYVVCLQTHKILEVD